MTLGSAMLTADRVLAETRRLFRRETLPDHFVAAGAMLACIAVIADYFATSSSFGLHQKLLLSFAVASMAGGVIGGIVTGARDVAATAKFWAVVAQVALLALAFRLYNLESRAFYELIVVLTLFGFIASHYLPAALRLPFFFSLSIAGLLGVIGVASPIAALATLAIGFSLIAICHLPIAMWARIAILIAAGASLAAMRVGWLETSWSGIVLPLLASIFMFRLVIYLYDIAAGKGPTSIWHRLSYFFMLPNIVFPFFPVVDFTTFGRTYYNDDPNRIYQRGATWMLRGFVHLLLYRVVKSYLLISPEDVVNAGTFLQYIIANFSLYLRISGLFHLVVGMLLLFGFNLPETHKRFFFSSSFIDFWRRINIYWKDFMQKIFFNPSFVRLKKLGASHLTSVVGSAFVVFFATWALHAYQWFWLRGTVLFTVPDMLFWSVLALFLVAQTVREARADRGRPAAAVRRFALSPRAFLVMRTLCTFMTICILWSMWTSETMAAWFALLKGSGLLPGFTSGETVPAVEWLKTLVVSLLVAFMAAVAAGASFGLAPAADALQDQRQRIKAGSSHGNFFASAAVCTALVGGLIVLQYPAVNGILWPSVQQVANDLSHTRLSARDQALLERGYYEGLTDVARLDSELWEILMSRPRDFDEIRDFPGVRMTGDYLEYEFIPMTSKVLNHIPYRINRWGMYDKDYELEKPARTYRIAIVEASRANGNSVQYDERFETLLEKRLNSEHGDRTAEKYEILNFSVEGYVPVQRLLVLDRKVWPFKPDAVFYIAGERDLYLAHHAEMVQRGVEIPYEFLRQITKEAEVDRTMSINEISRRLKPFRHRIVGGVYKHFAEACRQHGVQPVWIYVRNVYPDWADPEAVEMIRLAKEAGLEVLDYSRFWKDRDTASLRVSDWDNHPSAEGHRLLAEAMYQDLKSLEARGEISMGLR